MSESLIFASTNPQCDDRFFIVHENCKLKIPTEHVVYKNKKQFVCTTCSDIAIFMYWTRNSMNNLTLHCGLVDAKIRASDKDLPVTVNDLLLIWC